MSVAHKGMAAAESEVRYARFSRRLRGFLIDFSLFLVVLVGALSTARALDSDNAARAIGYAVVAGLLLYEPLLLPLTGGTIGHYFNNLRVVDDRRGTNISFLKAVARMIIKTVLGWFSFLSMLTSRRHQAVHDWLTRSTVQVRDASRADAQHYVRERAELSQPGMPSRLRRIVVILGYLIATFLLLGLTETVLVQAGLLSDACLMQKRCTSIEYVQSVVLGLSMIVAVLVVVGFGWRGRLPGSRLRPEAR